MRKAIFAVVFAAGLSACSTQVNTEVEGAADAVETVADSATVAQRVTDIYTEVFKLYNRMDSVSGAGGEMPSMPNVDSLYCSADWNEWVGKVKAYDEQHNDGALGFFEGDYWIMGQDWHNLGVSDVKVNALADSTAVVEIMLHNFDQVSPVCVEMTLEQGAWRIDNFIDVESSYDWKSSMKEYMSTKQKKD